MCDDTTVASRDSREIAQSSPTVAPASTEVSPDEEEPSREWGWHGGFPKGTIAGGVLTIIACLAFIPGPYQSTTQYLWLLGVVVIVLGGIIGHMIHKRNSWRR